MDRGDNKSTARAGTSATAKRQQKCTESISRLIIISTHFNKEIEFEKKYCQIYQQQILLLVKKHLFD
jgi:hypothetical protein